MDRGAWWATVHEVAKGQTQLRDFHFLRRLATTIHLVAIIYSPPIWKYTVSSPKISKYVITSSTSLKFRIKVDQVTIKSTVASLVAVGKESACNAGDLGSIPGSEDPLEKEMAWRIPWTEEPGGLQSMGSRRESDTTEVTYLPWICSCFSTK